MSYRKFYQKNNFLGGEAAPVLEGRSDLPQYAIGCSKMRNFISLRGGGATRRPGTRYVTNTGFTGAGNLLNNKARLIPFPISTTLSYLLEITTDSVAGTATKTTYKIISNLQSPSVIGTPVMNLEHGTGFVNESDLAEMQYASIGSNLIMVHPNFSPMVLAPDGGVFALRSFIQELDISSSPKWLRTPYMDPNATSKSLTLSAGTTGTGRTLTASSPLFAGTTADVGKRFRFEEGYVVVTAHSSTTVCTVTVESAAADPTATTNWAESAWSTHRGFPRAVGLYNQRLIFGGTSTQPDTFWMSETEDYGQMSPTDYTTIVASSPMNYTLASDQFNAIQWINGGKKLIIGTTSNEWVGDISLSSDGASTNIAIFAETAHGSDYRQAKRISYAVNFVEKGGKNLREMAFNFNSDSYVATDLNTFSSHVANEVSGDRISQIEYQGYPFQIIWALTSSGKLYGFTRDRQQNIAAWHSHVIGGTQTTSSTIDDTLVESIAVLPNPGNSPTQTNQDRLYLSCLRTINGSSVRFVEWLDIYRENAYTVYPGTSTDNRVFVDAAKVFTSGGSTTAVTGMTHLASSTAYVVAINTSDYTYGTLVYVGAAAVDASGNITLTKACNFAVVGIHANAFIRSLPQDGTEGPQVFPGAIRRVDQISVRLHDTYGLKIGPSRTFLSDGNLVENEDAEQIPFNINVEHVVTDSGVDVSLQHTFRGMKTITPPMDYDQEGGFLLKMEEPWPCTILGVTSRMVVNEV